MKKKKGFMMFYWSLSQVVVKDKTRCYWVWYNLSLKKSGPLWLELSPKPWGANRRKGRDLSSGIWNKLLKKSSYNSKLYCLLCIKCKTSFNWGEKEKSLRRKKLREKIPRRNSQMEKIHRSKLMRKTVSNSQVRVVTTGTVLLCDIFLPAETNINYSGNLDYITI